MLNLASRNFPWLSVFHESMNRSKDWQGGVWSARQMPPSRFVTRQAELSSEKVIKEITIDAQQRLQVKDGKSKVTCETHLELL